MFTMCQAFIITNKIIYIIFLFNLHKIPRVQIPLYPIYNRRK